MTDRRDPPVSVLLNVAHEVVQVGGYAGDDPAVTAVLRCGGQLIRVPRSVARTLRRWDRVHVLSIGVEPGAPPAPSSQQPAVPANAGSRFD